MTRSMQEIITREELEHRISEASTDEQFNLLPIEKQQEWDNDWAESIEGELLYEIAHNLADYNDAALGDLKLRMSNSREAYRAERLAQRQHMNRMIDNLISSIGG